MGAQTTNSSEFRDDFDLDPEIINLNSGTLSISPRTVINAQIEYIRKNNLNPTADLFDTWGHLWDVQKSVASFLNADPHYLFLCPNVTYAMNTFILGVGLPSDGEILISDFEYPAIVELCRKKAEDSGLTLRKFSFFEKPSDYKNATPELLAKRVKEELRENTRMLMLSHVLTMNGCILPIEEIGTLARNNGTFFAVDGAHGPGALDLDFSKMDSVDFYGANLHKWFMGPKGTGFGWIHPEVIDKVSPLLKGWTSAHIPPNFKAFADGNPFTGRFLQSSCVQFSPYFALKETVDYWEEKSPSSIRNRINELQSMVVKLCESQLPLKMASPMRKDCLGPLVSFEMPKEHVAQGFQFMKDLYEKEKVLVMTFPVNDTLMLRFTPHIYNTAEEIQTAVDTIKRSL